LVDLAALPGLALLPPRIRSEFDITWAEPKAMLAGALGTGVRLWTRVVPRGLRSMPQALAADRRVSRATISRQP
jgi:uncharacterized protein (DUF2236 family)